MGISGNRRTVMKVDPDMERRLYSVLAGDGLTLEVLLTEEATAYISYLRQGQFFGQSAKEPTTREKPRREAPHAAA